MEQIKIDRINELAKLKKERPLTTTEQEEHKKLREEFLIDFRSGFEQQLKGIKVVKVDNKK
ncbi:DUF896 domain-containing protein [Spiroplasma endosymbiont of Othius punctulatus]|uniref:DUF896 domain-containing protein n=1 Tax=Spiroplasma endosymbiont of Othius punctulatus TaxID=3066289 RepID=UPI0030D528CC